MVEGGYFGDLDIIFKRKRRYSMISTVDSDFLYLSKQLFDDVIIKEYPEVYEEMILVGVEREKKVLAAKAVALIEYEEMMKNKGTLDSPYRKFKQYQEASKKSEYSLEDFSSRINNASQKSKT